MVVQQPSGAGGLKGTAQSVSGGGRRSPDVTNCTKGLKKGSEQQLAEEVTPKPGERHEGGNSGRGV